MKIIPLRFLNSRSRIIRMKVSEEKLFIETNNDEFVL